MCGNEDLQTDLWELQSGIYDGDGFHPRHSFSGWAKPPDDRTEVSFRQFFDFRFGVNASRFFNLPHPIPTLRKLRNPRCPSRNLLLLPPAGQVLSMGCGAEN
jgi:hypothetical protein